MKPADIQTVIDRLEEACSRSPAYSVVSINRSALEELIGQLETLRDLMEQDQRAEAETLDLPRVTSILE